MSISSIEKDKKRKDKEQNKNINKNQSLINDDNKKSFNIKSKYILKNILEYLKKIT